MMSRMKKIFVFLFRMLKIIRREIRSGKRGYQFLERTIIRREMDKNLLASGQKSDKPTK
jgi:hypothetical protein